MQEPTPKQALDAARKLAASGQLGVHHRCMPYLRLLTLSVEAAREIVANATPSQVIKSERDRDPSRPYWVLELSVPHENSPTGLLYVKPVLYLPSSLCSGYILSFKPSTD